MPQLHSVSKGSEAKVDNYREPGLLVIQLHMPRQSPSSPSIREFELVVLLAVMSLHEDAYPVSIRNAIEARTQRNVSRAAVFITLERLESKGFVTSRYGDPTPVRSGRAKRFFRETPAGVAAAKEAIHTMKAMTAGLGEVLE